MASISPEIFKAYDVRGIYPDDVDDDVAYRVARGFARVIAALKHGTQDANPAGLRLGVGHDMRVHSPALAEAFSRGLDGGASITASHNPKAWAGFKLLREGAIALSGEQGIQDVRRQVEADQFSKRNGSGSVTRADIYEEFQHYVLGFIEADLIRPMEIVVDGG